MTSKTSLFNKGIYKSTVRRFTWGSVLYFILLFMSTSFVLLMQHRNYDMARITTTPKCPMILQQSYFIIPLLLAAAVPTVVALLIFRFVHSKRQAVFIHSIPVSRTANYISSILAGFTLMAVPVVLNGIILMIISVTEYSKLFSVVSCFEWIGINLLVLFIMFAYAAFSAVITGNTVAAVVLNGLLHSFLLIITAGFGALASAFLYGYAEQNVIMNFLTGNLPLPWIFSSFARDQHIFSAVKALAQIGAAAVFYALAYVLYRLRRLETAEDIAGFACLNPVFKYLVTSLAALAAFGVFSMSLSETRIAVLIVVIVATIVAYFACEMLLKKTLRVWRAYRGYLGFAAAAAIVFYVFAFTGFFGYESFVPDISDIESITAYEYYNEEEPWVKDAAVKRLMTERHQMLTEQAHTLNCWMDIESDTHFDRSYVTIGYKMNNGDVIKRRYPIAYDDKRAMMREAYTSEEYRKNASNVFTDDIADIVKMSIGNVEEQRRETELDAKQAKELFECIKADTLGFGYDEAVIDYGAYQTVHASIQYISKKAVKEKEELGEEVYAERYGDEDVANVRYIYVGINGNYKSTVDWLKKNGYGYLFEINNASNVYVYRIPESRQGMINNLNVNSDAGYSAPQTIQVGSVTLERDSENNEPTKFDSENYIKLSAEDREKALEYVYSAHIHDLSDVAYYNLYFSWGDEAREDDCQILMSVAENEIPEFLKKYLN